MLEAWLLFDKDAIRHASGNSDGIIKINLPKLKNAESLKDPKETLFNVLRIASEKSGRKLKQLNSDMPVLRHRVSELIEDFSPLRSLQAFQQLELDIKQIIDTHDWK